MNALELYKEINSNYVSAWSSFKYACVGQVKPQETKRVGLPSGMNLMSNHIAMVRQTSAVLEEVTRLTTNPQ